ncbi:MAG: helix-turn-helix domain-containing protein [Phyllobacteriaceae bacterium]|nr:helix-turn-helix domain-containing protein [Phyllobacteriaceae bacterium]
MKTETPARPGAASGGETTPPSPPLSSKATLQTLERGLRVLALISESETGLSIAEISARLGVDRAIGHRLAGTLEATGFLTRRSDGQFVLGAEILTLADRFLPQLRAVAGPPVGRLAQATGAAAFVSVPQGDACVAIIVAEPEAPLLRLSYRVGSRHPLSLGAAGIAILAGRAETEGDAPAVREARRLGHALTCDQLQRGAVGVASPLHGPDRRLGFEACVGVVALDGLDVEGAAAAVTACARDLVEALRPGSSAL